MSDSDEITHGLSMKAVEDDDLLASILADVTPEDLQTFEENRAEQGEYGKLLLDFLFAEPPKKVIELEITPGSESPLQNRRANAVAIGFRNALKKAKIGPDRAVVITKTNAEGRTAAYLINVQAARRAKR